MTVSLILSLVFLLLFVGSYWIGSFTRRSKSIMDDYATLILRWHFLLGFLLALGSFFVMWMQIHQWSVAYWVNSLFIGLQVSNIAFAVVRISKLGLPALSDQLFKNFDNRAFGFAVPLLARAMSVIMAFGLLLLFIHLFAGAEGFRTTLAIIGALSFLLAYIFQEPLQNLFGGVSLLTDPPFEYGDMIILDDGEMYRVDRTGSRVTQLYNIKKHHHTYVPNIALASQSIVNLTHPDTELRDTIEVGVAYDSDIDRVICILETLAGAHPHTLGLWEQKQKAMQEASKLVQEPASETLLIQRHRMSLDQELRDMGESLYRQLNLTAEYAKRCEAYGLSDRQREHLLDELEDLHEEFYKLVGVLIKWLRCEAIVDRTRIKRIFHKDVSSENFEGLIRQGLDLPSTKIKNMMENPGTDSAFLYVSSIFDSLSEFQETLEDLEGQPCLDKEQVHKLARKLDCEISDMSAFADVERTFRSWFRRCTQLYRQLQNAKACLTKVDARDYLAHQHLFRASQIVKTKFKMKVPAQLFPGADIVEFGPSAILLRLEYFVDNIAGEHFKRMDIVKTELYGRIHRVLAAEKIDIPYTTITLHDRR